MSTVIVWYRNDLRVHDHPALAAAAKADVVVPVFVFSDQILTGPHASANRNRFLLECLTDLKQGLQNLGADLLVRHGNAADELAKLAAEADASEVYYTADFSPFATRRDAAVAERLDRDNIVCKAFPGRLIVEDFNQLRTKTGKQHQVFTPFYNNWQRLARRELVMLPPKLTLPANLTIGELPVISSVAGSSDLSPDVIKGGETDGRKRLEQWLGSGIKDYDKNHNDLAADATSRLSPYLHFGCLSAYEIETMLPPGDGANAWHRQLCWRDFYHYVLKNNPTNAKYEFQIRYRELTWGTDQHLLSAWQQGKTGYPVVDAAMRQLDAEGWMHNRARLIVGSFLTKDLWLDWRLGEQYFMSRLLDGDEANNNGNWQWIASVGVDPAPAFRRMYNPSSQQRNYDASGDYVRRYVPELKQVPDTYLAEPWTMPSDIQDQSNCVIGQDYPAPIVDHKVAREAALEHYRTAS